MDLNAYIKYPEDKKLLYMRFYKRLGWLRSEVMKFTDFRNPVPEKLQLAVGDMLTAAGNDLRDSDDDESEASRHADASARRVCWLAGIPTYCQITGERDAGSP